MVVRPRARPAFLSAQRATTVHLTLAGDYRPRQRHAAPSGNGDAGHGRRPSSTGCRAAAAMPTARRARHDIRTGPPARRTDPADRRRDRTGQRHHQRAGPDRLERRAARSPRPAISRPPTWTSRRRSARSPGSAATIHFTDLLGLDNRAGPDARRSTRSTPASSSRMASIHYQLLPGQLVKIERGEWPFMGGRLILQETVLNFGSPTAKRLTFEVDRSRRQHVRRTLGFKELERDRHLRRRAADDLRRERRADRRRPARIRGRRRLACL